MKSDEALPGGGSPGGEENLRRRIADYEARLAALAELASRVRHEINNPLTGLLGQTQLLQREDLSETTRRRVEAIEQLATRIRDTAAELRAAETPHLSSGSAPEASETSDDAEPPRH